MTRRVLAWSVLAVGLAATATAADWPQWRGPNRDGKSADQGLLRAWPEGGPKLVWKIDNLDKVGTGYGSLAVVGDRLYAIGAADESKEAKESLVSINTKDGNVVWKTPLGTSPGTFMLQGWGRGPRSTPTVSGDHIYVLGVVGDLVCIKASDGLKVWGKNLKSDFGGAIPKWGYSESPLVDDGKVVCVPGGKGGMVALDSKTGSTVWHCKDFNHETGYASIVAADIGGVRQYITQTMKSGVGVAAKDGKLLWEAGELARSTAVIPTPIVKDNHVFFTSGYGAGCELYKLEPDGDGTKATKVYSKNKAVANHHGGVIEVDGMIYGHSDSKQWFCFDMMAGGDPVWTSNKLGKGSISYADGYFICYSEGKGEVALIKASKDGWEESGRFTIPKTSATRPGMGKVWPHPVIANGKLYLRDYENLYCYDLASPGP